MSYHLRHLRWLGLSACLAAAYGHAQLPAPLTTGHPHLMVNQARFDSLKTRLPIAPANFPAAGGTIEFDWTPRAKGPFDNNNDAIFGIVGSTNNSILIRHEDASDGNGDIGLQLGLLQKTIGAVKGDWVANTSIKLRQNTKVHIALNWDSAKRQASYAIDYGTPITMKWKGMVGTPAEHWQANEQIFEIGARHGEQVGKFKVRDLQGTTIFDHPEDDLGMMAMSWRDFIGNVNTYRNTLAACVPTATPAAEPSTCDVANGNQDSIFQVAEQLALAYKLGGDRKYLDAARKYVDLMDILPANAGGEYAMGGRVAALGIIYDWLYNELDDASSSGMPVYRSLIPTIIKKTIQSGLTQTDLSNYLCDYKTDENDKVVLNIRPASDPVVDCAVKPIYDYRNWNRSANPHVPSLAPYYIGGHQISDISSAAFGALAIAAEYPEVLPLIDTLYAHFDQGFWPVKAQVSIDGGHQMGFGYSLEGNLAATLQLWRSAFDTGSSPAVFQADWQNKMIYPYIYGLRSNLSYPARGDNFDMSGNHIAVAKLALMAASQAGDGVAQAFYRQQIQGSRASQTNNLLELLYFPQANSAPVGDISTLPLSRRFRVGGLVIARDRWDYANATVLDFKASNFSSDNHQHFDQNSFSLYYKAPLLLDSGAYDKYNTPHRYNYTIRTIAHNTITVFKPEERFTRNNITHSNDGGQWYATPTYTYPTLGDIQPGGANYQDGIVNYEYDPRYTYVRGNASKAYSSVKLDQANGFLRSLIFLPSSPFWGAPVTLVFDTVRPATSGLETTFLLHMTNEPAAAVGATDQLSGRYRLAFADGAARQVTVRNQGGMATIQTLLPENATVLKVGGTSASCPQVKQVMEGGDGGVANDCRFTVRDMSSGSAVWRNYAPLAEADKFNIAKVDYGAWRLEVGGPVSQANVPQYFLHVIGVADNDNGSGLSAMPSAQRLVADSDTEAVRLGTSTVILFNRNSAPATSLSFVADLSQPSILATGLKPDAAFSLLTTTVAGGTRFQLTETSDGSATLRSSGEGVVTLNF
ncbi:MAG: heparinase II/III family protein [Pseudomonadota bacterium]